MHTLNLLSCSILNINFMISVSIPFEIVSSLSTLHFIIFIFYLTNTVIEFISASKLYEFPHF